MGRVNFFNGSPSVRNWPNNVSKTPFISYLVNKTCNNSQPTSRDCLLIALLSFSIAKNVETPHLVIAKRKDQVTQDFESSEFNLTKNLNES